jgi:hypothetical protein
LRKQRAKTRRRAVLKNGEINIINTIHLRAATRGLVSTAANKSAAPTLIALLHLKQFTSQI